jgi:CRISPR system Cascade subunit CasE
MTATMPAASPATKQPSMTPLHLTQILVSYEDAARLLRIRDTYDWHQKVWQAFGGRDGAPRDFLTRVDRLEENYRLIIVSGTQPHKPDWCPTGCFETKVMPDAFFNHARYRFSLLANPTKKLRVDSPDGTRKKNGRRVPLGKREELVAWLQRKAEAGGFRFDAQSLRTVPRGREYFHKPGTTGLHSAVEFQGVLEVTDAAAFRTTLQCGIGSAKAFGFGLLVIAPLQ